MGFTPWGFLVEERSDEEGAPPPANDTCATASLLSQAVLVTGTNVSASDDYSSTSGPAYSSPCDQLAFSGKDVVYEFRPAAGGSFTATLQPSGSFDAALLLLQPVCGAGSCTAVSDRPGQGLSETLTFSGTAGQSYFLVVDAWDGQSGNSSGSFAIRVQ